MGIASTVQVAVALLSERVDTERYYRRRSNFPLQGYALLSTDGRHCQASVGLENARTLTDRTGAAGFYYEAWIVVGDQATSLGALNTGPTGDGFFVFDHPASQLRLGEAARLRITAEPFGGSHSGQWTLLEAPLVWLAGGPPSGPVSPESQAPPLPQAAPFDDDGAATEQTPEPPSQEQVPAPAAEQSTATADPPSEQAAPSLTQPQPPAPEPDLPNSDAAPAQVTTPGDTNLDTTTDSNTLGEPPIRSITLLNRHPLAPRATGTATIDTSSGTVTINVRGLPTPAALGREITTDRPFNGYRVWLFNQRTGSRYPLGICARVWGENFRFQSETGLPLSRYDAVLLTADDRNAPQPNPSAPHVLLGPYRTAK